MAKIGFHASVAGGIEKSVERAKQQSADTFQLFLNSPRVWAYPIMTRDQISSFKTDVMKNEYTSLTVHLSYLPNLATYEVEKQDKSFTAIKEAVIRCDRLEIQNLVMHIGSHRDKGIDTGIQNTITMLDRAISLEPEVNLLLETSSGSSKLVGNTFEELDTIIRGVSDPTKVGVCFDTCHVFAAGYDLASNAEGIIEQFDSAVGFEKLKVIHANDCKGELGSKRDRHEHIGLGHIGTDGFSYLLNHKKLDVPFIIETPVNSIRNNIDNMNVLRSLVL